MLHEVFRCAGGLSRDDHCMKLVERSLYSPKPWLIFDGDISWSRARFTEFNEAGQYVPEAVDAVVSGGASIDNFHRTFASLRLRLLRSVRAHRGQLGAIEGDDTSEFRRWISVRQGATAERAGLQPPGRHAHCASAWSLASDASSARVVMNSRVPPAP